MATSSPVGSDAGFVLHTYAYRETSLIVEAFTRQHGRLSLLAKGARRARSATRGLLQAFQPLLLSWLGKSELKILKSTETERIYPQLQGPLLMSAFYLNELLMKLLAREDPHERLFDAYQAALAALGSQAGRDAKRPLEPILRTFERSLMSELGYGLTLDRDAHGQSLAPQARYAYVLDKGAVPLGEMNSDALRLPLLGKTLLDLARDDFEDPITARESKQLMRLLINHHLQGVELNTRQLIRDLQHT